MRTNPHEIGILNLLHMLLVARDTVGGRRVRGAVTLCSVRLGRRATLGIDAPGIGISPVEQ